MKQFISLVLLTVISSFVNINAQSTDTLVISNGERRIFGILHRPVSDTSKPLPIAIVAHGFNGNHKQGCNYFEALGEAGYQCFTFDFPCGSVKSAIDSNTVNMSLRDQQSDLIALVDYFGARNDVDPGKVVLIGESQGGLVASLVGSAMPDKVSKLVLTFAAFCIPDHHNGKYPSPQQIPDTTYIWNVPLGKRYFEELRTIDAYSDMTNFAEPVLLVHGDKDPVVPLSYSEKAVAIYPDARLKVIKGAGHGFKKDEFALYMSWLKDFLK